MRNPNSQDWSCQVPDRRYGAITLSGILCAASPASELLIVVHGLGGSSESGYMRAAAEAATSVGLSSLRLNLRGADRRGEDYYHAGLWQDLDTVVGHRSLERFAVIYLLGYSIGGQLCLHWASNGRFRTSRVRALASVCAPLDLAKTARNLDRSASIIYRSHVLRGLNRAYRSVAARRTVPLSVRQAARITSIVQWDDQITAPRHGFDDAEHYYTQSSVGPCLHDVAGRTLMVIADQDPMVPLTTVEPALAHLSPDITVKRLARGGHVGFPSSVSLGQPGRLGLEHQIITWLRSPAQD